MNNTATIRQPSAFHILPDKARLLAVDSDQNFLSQIEIELQTAGYQVTTAASLMEARSAFKPDRFALVLLDLVLANGEGLDLLREIIRLAPEQPVVIISEQAIVRKVVEAIKAGAKDFVQKPLGRERLLLTVRNIIENNMLWKQKARLQRDLEVILDEARQRYHMVGASRAMQQIFALIDRCTQMDTNVLITGETGVGKELTARAIYLNSKRASRILKVVNCSNISDELLESELFGHVKGAFTGAYHDKSGLFQVANGGTLFLDEIGDLSLRAQAKVLRAIEYGEIMPVGATKSEKVDVRLIASTNRNLAKMVEEGLYREDLYYRLDGIHVNVPPLRERADDIPVLAQHFMEFLCHKKDFPVKTLTADALAVLKLQPWKGNVRELLQFMQRLVFCTDNLTISSDLVWKVLRFDYSEILSHAENNFASTLYEAREQFERDYILTSLRKNSYNKTHTAIALGIKRQQLYHKMEKLGIKGKRERLIMK